MSFHIGAIPDHDTKLMLKLKKKKKKKVGVRQNYNAMQHAEQNMGISTWFITTGQFGYASTWIL